MNLTTISAELSLGQKIAHRVWDETYQGWQDAVAEDFKNKHWTPLMDEVTAVIAELDKMQPLLSRMYRECS